MGCVVVISWLYSNKLPYESLNIGCLGSYKNTFQSPFNSLKKASFTRS